MIRKALLLRLFDAAYMQRWNDHIRPVALTELDKQGHKMLIAYLLGKFEEDDQHFNWLEVMEGGTFELLQRIVLTDLKPPIFYRIKQDHAKYRQLNDWVYDQLKPVLSPLGESFRRRFRDYFLEPEDTLNRRVLRAAHLMATRWEFKIIERADPDGYEIPTIKEDLDRRIGEFSDLEGVRQITDSRKLTAFVNMCGQLRFQARWAHLHRVPRTSVLGHSLFVAVLCHLFSLELNACGRRFFNNYFSGLFHDLPEVLTRDIISPVKRSVTGLSDLIKEYEKEQMEREVYHLIPKAWHGDIRRFTEDEFTSVVMVDGRRRVVSTRDINDKYNDDGFDPRDGELVKAADRMAAFVEACEAIRNGGSSAEFQEAKLSIKHELRALDLGNLDLGQLCADFD